MISALGIIIFPDPGFHCIAMESDVRPYWPKTCHVNGTIRAINVYVLLWALYNVLGTSAKVRTHVCR
jgi:hypothetical protein